MNEEIEALLLAIEHKAKKSVVSDLIHNLVDDSDPWSSLKKSVGSKLAADITVSLLIDAIGDGDVLITRSPREIDAESEMLSIGVVDYECFVINDTGGVCIEAKGE